MFGEVMDIIVKTIRGAKELKPAKLSVIAITTDETQTVNTPLPAVAVAFEESMNADVFIGGMIRDRFNIRICVMADLTNFSWSADGGEQAKLLSLAHSVRNVIEKAKATKAYSELYAKYDFYPLYKGFRTYQRIAMRNDFKKEISVIELVYQTTMLDKCLKADMNPTCTVEQVDIARHYGLASDLTTSITVNNG